MQLPSQPAPMVEPLIRDFTEADYPLLEQWFSAHGSFSAPPRAMLPKLGVVAMDENNEPLAFAFLYMDNSVGVCWIEYPVTRPGLTLAQARMALGSLLEFLRISARSMGYGIMVAYTLKPIARELERHGFHITRSDMVMCVASTEDRHHGN